MTGPRTPLVHPHRRRGRLLLPFLLVIGLSPLACTSDQPTETTSSNLPISAGVHHPYLMVDAGASAAIASATPQASLSVAAASGTVATGPKVLILADADGFSTAALASSVAAAGFQVTSRPAPEYTWDGTNPALTGFAAVIHLNGATWNIPLPVSAQAALTSFVQNGGGFIGAQWNGYEATVSQTAMPNLVLQTYGFTGREGECAGSTCHPTYSTIASQAGHPVLRGVPSSFTFQADGHHAGPIVSFATDPSMVLMQTATGAPAVLVRTFGSGKVVNFSFAPNYGVGGAGVTLLDPNIQQLYVNALYWTTGWTPVSDQTITFAALTDKTFGDPAFSVAATASSGLEVSFTAAGKCTISGTTVTLTGAGSCTVTAHQGGNASYHPAATVSQSFAIAKGAAALALGNLSQIYNGSPLGATVTTSPAGLGTVAVTYNGSSTPPVNAGSYAVAATLQNDDYQATPASGTLVIAKAPATVTVGTEFVYDGTPKQARITTSPAGLTVVTVTYTLNGVPVTSPTDAGIYQVVAHLDNPNFEAPQATGTLTIKQAMPLISWATPAAILAGTPLSAAQLDATASGVGGTALTGGFLYTPRAGSVLGVGPQTLSVQFIPASGNYSPASKTVQISVNYRFAGFFKPVKNLPMMNIVRAGRAIPIKFSLGRYEGLQVMQPGTPTVLNAACTTPSETMTDEDESENSSGLRAEGYKYTYVWKTSSTWAGTCRKLVITLADGTSHAALFRFVKGHERDENKGNAEGQDKGKDKGKSWSKAFDVIRSSK